MASKKSQSGCPGTARAPKLSQPGPPGATRAATLSQPGRPEATRAAKSSQPEPPGVNRAASGSDHGSHIERSEQPIWVPRAPTGASQVHIEPGRASQRVQLVSQVDSVSNFAWRAASSTCVSYAFLQYGLHVELFRAGKLNQRLVRLFGARRAAQTASSDLIGEPERPPRSASGRSIGLLAPDRASQIGPVEPDRVQSSAPASWQAGPAAQQGRQGRSAGFVFFRLASAVG